MLTGQRGLSGRAAALWCMTLALFFLAPSGLAESPAGELRIEVKDPSGAAVAASGKLQNLALGTVQNYETDARGSHIFSGLARGRYRLEVSATGFATQMVSINVQSEGPIARTVTLSL